MKILVEKLKGTAISGIYKINYPNGKAYIGQSQNIYKRINEHNSYAFNGHGKHSLQLCEQAIKKYGKIMEIEILEQDIPLEQLDEKEQYWINFYYTTDKDKGYNILDYGDVSERRGVNHPNSAFNEQELQEIIDLLQNHTELSYIDIANKYGVSKANIYRINAGLSYTNPELNYPLRKNNHDAAKKDDVLDYFNSVDELLQLKEELLYNWELPIENGLEKKYCIPLRIIREINKGTLFNEYGNYKYPIREKNLRNNKNFTIQTVTNILNDLRNTSLSMSSIGEKYGIYRDTVSKINKGSTYLIKDFDYPARKT